MYVPHPPLRELLSCMHAVLYSGKLQASKLSRIFAVKWPPAKIFSTKFLAGHTHLYDWYNYSNTYGSTKVFSLKSFPLYDITIQRENFASFNFADSQSLPFHGLIFADMHNHAHYIYICTIQMS